MAFPQVQIGGLAEFSFTPTLDTAIFADKDLMQAAANTLTGVGDLPGQYVELVRAEVFDAADQASALDIWFVESAVTLAAANAPHALSDADLLLVTGVARVAAADYHDANTGQVASVSPALVMRLADTSKNLLVLLVSRGTGTFGATDITVRLTFRRLS